MSGYIRILYQGIPEYIKVSKGPGPPGFIGRIYTIPKTNIIISSIELWISIYNMIQSIYKQVGLLEGRPSNSTSGHDTFDKQAQYI